MGKLPLMYRIRAWFADWAFMLARKLNPDTYDVWIDDAQPRRIQDCSRAFPHEGPCNGWPSHPYEVDWESIVDK